MMVTLRKGNIRERCIILHQPCVDFNPSVSSVVLAVEYTPTIVGSNSILEFKPVSKTWSTVHAHVNPTRFVRGVVLSVDVDGKPTRQKG
jgi:hypothetical protein